MLPTLGKYTAVSWCNPPIKAATCRAFIKARSAREEKNLGRNQRRLIVGLWWRETCMRFRRPVSAGASASASASMPRKPARAGGDIAQGSSGTNPTSTPLIPAVPCEMICEVSCLSCRHGITRSFPVSKCPTSSSLSRLKTRLHFLSACQPANSIVANHSTTGHSTTTTLCNSTACRLHTCSPFPAPPSFLFLFYPSRALGNSALLPVTCYLLPRTS